MLRSSRRGSLIRPAGNQLDVLYRLGDSMARKRTVCDGDRIFDITASSPEDNFVNVAEDAFVALASFRLLNPTGEVCVETRQSWTEERPVHLQFEYPVLGSHARRARRRLLASALSEFEESLTGQLRIECHQMLDGLDPLQIVHGYADSLKDMGLHPRWGLRSCRSAPCLVSRQLGLQPRCQFRRA